MNINQLLRKLPDELVTDLATKFGLPLTTSTSNQAEMTIIPYLKRNPKEEGDKLLDNIESSLRPYELKRLLSIFRVGSQSYPDFQSIRDNLSPLPYLSDTDESDDFDIVSQMEEAEQEWQISQHEISEIEDNEEVDSSVKTSNLQIQPKKLIDVFRSMNYSLGQAVSDLIDNSIDSGAKNVNVMYKLDEDLAVRFLIVADDGKGMSAPELEDALTLGADREYRETDTGKFGIGLKLSSFSQASDVTIITQLEDEEDYNLRRLSYNYIVKTNKLKLLHNTKPEAHIDEALGLLPNSGTCVLLEGMDKRHLNLRRKAVIDSFEKSKDNLAEFLSMTFHRYIDGTTTGYNVGRQVNIFLNGTQLKSLDPLFLSEDSTKSISSDISYRYDDEKPKIDIKCNFTVIPNRLKLDEDLYERLKTVAKSPKDQQGLYYYRNDRLIAFGGWRGLLKKELDDVLVEHASRVLARIAIDVPVEMDDAFSLTPTKTNYQPPEEFLINISRIAHNSGAVVWEYNNSPASFLGYAKKRYEEAKGTSKSKSKRSSKGARSATPIKTVNVESYHSESVDPVTLTKKNGEFKISINKSHELYGKVIKKLRENLG